MYSAALLFERLFEAPELWNPLGDAGCLAGMLRLLLRNMKDVGIVNIVVMTLSPADDAELMEKLSATDVRELLAEILLRHGKAKDALVGKAILQLLTRVRPRSMTAAAATPDVQVVLEVLKAYKPDDSTSMFASACRLLSCIATALTGCMLAESKARAKEAGATAETANEVRFPGEKGGSLPQDNHAAVLRPSDPHEMAGFYSVLGKAVVFLLSAVRSDRTPVSARYDAAAALTFVLRASGQTALLVARLGGILVLLHLCDQSMARSSQKTAIAACASSQLHSSRLPRTRSGDRSS